MNLLSDINYNLNLLKKNYNFTILCVAVIAIGMAIALPFYSIADNLYLKSLNVDNSDRYTVFKPTGQIQRTEDTVPNYDLFHYQYFKNNAQSYSSVEAWHNNSSTISDGKLSQSFRSNNITVNLLALTGVQPLLGRLLTKEDALPGAEPVVLLRYDLWQNYYVGREDIIGHTSRIDGELKTVVGILPDSFNFPMNQDLWMPLQLSETPLPGGESERLVVVGLLADGTTIKQARLEAGILQDQIFSNWPNDYPGNNIKTTVVPFAGMFLEPSAVVGLLFPTFVLFLLIAFNVGNLFIARGEERIQELAIRSALGATPRRVAQALLQESFVICLLGLILGVCLSIGSLSVFNNVILNVNPNFDYLFWWDMSMDSSLLLMALVGITIIWLLSGGLPAWRISKVDINDFLSNGSKGINNKGSSKLGTILVNVQIIFGCILLILALSSVLGSTVNTNYGINTTNKYKGRISFTTEEFSSPQVRQNYIDDLAQALLNQPEVESVSFTSDLPAGGARTATYNIEDRDLEFKDNYPSQYLLSISGNYFDTLEGSIIQGRAFTAADDLASLPVVIADQRLVENLWPNETALGKRIQLNPENETQNEWLTIVGIAAPITQESSLAEDQSGTPVLYRPIKQAIPMQFSVFYSTRQPDPNFDTTLRTAATQANRDIPVDATQSLEQLVETGLKSASLIDNIFIVLTFVAVFLTGLATYGMASRNIGRKQVEIGIRRALGASKKKAFAVFIKEGTYTIMIGLGLGTIFGILITYAIFSASDNVFGELGLIIQTSFWVGLILSFIIFLAHYFPAKKIIAMEPGDALRYEQ